MRSSNSFMFCCYAISNGSKTAKWLSFGCQVVVVWLPSGCRLVAKWLSFGCQGFVAMPFRMVPKPQNVLKRTKQLINVFKLL